LGRLFAARLSANGALGSLLVRPSSPLAGSVGQITVRNAYSAKRSSGGTVALDETHRVRFEPSEGGVSAPVIGTLVVATKAFAVGDALEGILHRLRPESVVLVLSNGALALRDELEKRFPGCTSSATNRTYAPFCLGLGTTTHGAYLATPEPTSPPPPPPPRLPTDLYSETIRTDTSGTQGGLVVHAGFGRCWFGPARSHQLISGHSGMLPEDVASKRGLSEPPPQLPPSLLSPCLLAKSVGAVSAADLSFPEVDHGIEIRLWQKLCANAVLNPLTALWDCENGEVFSRGAEGRLLGERVAREIAAVAAAMTTPMTTTTTTPMMRTTESQ